MWCNKEYRTKRNEIRVKWLKSNQKEVRKEYIKMRKHCKKTKREWINDKRKEIELENLSGNTKQLVKKIDEQNKVSIYFIIR